MNAIQNQEPKSILDYNSPGWKEYYERAEQVANSLSEEDYLRVQAVVKKLGIYGLWKGYYPAIYEVAKLLGISSTAEVGK